LLFGYWSIFVSSLNEFSYSIFDNNIDAGSRAAQDKMASMIPYFEDWKRITGSQSKRHLTQQEFLNSFYNYMQDISDINHYSFQPGVFSLYDMLVDILLRNTFDDKNNGISNLFYQTPHEVIKQTDAGIRLLRYRENSLDTAAENKKLAPLLIIYAPINRYHILDISRDRSIINKFVSSGFDVFLVDWGTQEKSSLTMADYVNCIGNFIEHVKRITDSESVSVHGYSWAGVLSIIFRIFPTKS
jgi:hypothetical protein